VNQYQYNGKELQDELDLGWLDYGMRMYQPEIGRWGAVDPLAEKYYPVTPYAYVANSPVSLMDPNGAEIWLSFTYQNEDGEEVTTRLEYRNKALYTEGGDEYDGSDTADPVFQLVKDQLNAIQELTEGKEGGDEVAKIFSDLQSTDKDHDINIFLEPANEEGESAEEKHVNFNRDSNLLFSGSVTYFNPLETRYKDGDKVEESNPMIQLLHELKHAHDRQIGTRRGSRGVRNIVTRKIQTGDDYEFRAVDTENILRKALGVPRRTTYGGARVPDLFVNH
jgi:RHS repeat-associated protein